MNHNNFFASHINVCGIVLLIGLIIGPDSWGQSNIRTSELMPIPDFHADIHIHPENATVHDYIHLSGELVVNSPESAFSLNQNIDQDGNVVISVDMSDEISTEGRFLHQNMELSLGKLKAGNYQVLILMNEEEIQKIEYSVVDAAPRPTPTPNPISNIIQDVMMDYVPGTEDYPLQFIVHGTFTNAGSTISGGMVSLEDNAIRLDLKVNPGEEHTRDFEPFEYFFDVKPLPVGEYIAVLYINEIAAFRIPVDISDPLPEPTPTPWPLPEIPIEDLSMDFDPAMPMANQPFQYYVSGWFHTSDTKIIDTNVTISDEGIINLYLDVEPGPDGPEVLTKFERVFEIEGLPAGEYTALLNINNVTVRKQWVAVWEGMPTAIPEPIDPQLPIFDIDFAILPTIPNPGESFQIIVEGFFPTGETFIKYPFVEFVNEEIWLNVQVENWDQGPEVLTKFSQPFDIMSLAAGEYKLKFFANGALHAETSFTVGDGSPPKNFGPYRSQFIINTDQPQAGETFDVLFNATFPTAGFIVNPAELAIQDNQVVAEVNIIEPTGPVAQVITPVEMILGELTLDAGTYELQGIVNGIELTSYRFTVVESITLNDPMLIFRREGGFAGTQSWVELHEGELFVRNNELSEDQGLKQGTVPADIWDNLFELMDGMDFKSMPEGFEPEIPVADGFTFTVTYQGNSVYVMDGAEIPAELEETIELLRVILNELPGTDASPRFTDGEETSVLNWKKL